MRWLLIATVCVACKGKHAPKRDDAAPPPADAVPIDAAVDAPPVDAALSHVITSDSVGPITTIAIDEEMFKRLLPGFSVKSEHREAEDYSYEEIVASQGSKAILRAVVEDRKLFKVEVSDPMFTTAAGLAVGMTAAELAGKMTDIKCNYEKYDAEADAEHVDRALRCESQSLPHILFEIDHAGFKGRVGTVATKAIATRKIVEIVWLAPAE